jgi:hypothetical protein
VSDLTEADLVAILAGDPDELGVHLNLVERDIVIAGMRGQMHCHCLTVDGNGRIRLMRLAEFMRNAVADYAIPRSKMNAARARDLQYRTSAAVTSLHREACATFTDLERSGEGGEMLLFLLAERFLKLPQILCKMALKTDTRMHYHGADGVYAGVTDGGLLKLYWGESKVYKDATTAIRDCLSSLAPFLIEPDHEGAGRERDLLLLSDRADLADDALTGALRRYFDRTSPQSLRVEYSGIALVGFDADFYPRDGVKAITDDITAGARAAINNWVKNIGSRLSVEKLDQFDIQFFCVPLPSVEEFRMAFQSALGIKK